MGKIENRDQGEKKTMVSVTMTVAAVLALPSGSASVLTAVGGEDDAGA
jgi:hypothetical protein